MRLLSHKTLLLSVLALFMAPAWVCAQTEPAAAPPSLFETQALAVDEASLSAGSQIIRLWGVDPIMAGLATFKLQARTALDNKIGDAPVECEIKLRTTDSTEAQCVNSNDEDLGLYMLQEGNVVVDRSVIYGSPYQEAYLNAERQAQQKHLGIWSEGSAGSKGSPADNARTLLVGAFIIFMLFIASFVFLAFVMMRGFKNFMDTQDRSNDLMAKERELKTQERRLVASMLNAELRANKSKIEAYLMIYNEMLKTIRDPTKAPSYTKTGDIVQMQPALDRSVFDRNTDKMDLLGRRLSSEIIHFYARVKTNPDYTHLEPDTPLETARDYVEKAVANAKRLDDLLVSILDLFSKTGLGSTDD